MTYRQIDLRGVFSGDARALDGFANAYAIDCGGCDDTFRRAYGWTAEALEDAKDRAFGAMLTDPSDTLAW